MILILSRSRYELTTDDVIDWLSYYNVPFKRVNGEYLIENEYHIEISNNGGTDFSQTIYPEENDLSVWFRRWYEIDYDEGFLDRFNTLNFKQGLSLHSHFKREVKRISDFYWDQLPSEKIIDHPRYVDLNKLRVLHKAAESRLNVPNTLITTSSNKIREFIKANGRVIAKPIGELLFLEYNDYSFMTLTKEIVANDIERDLYFPTLFQQYIDKRYELRIFVLEDRIYSMAIFSQSDDQTKIDFRKYNLAKMNRYVPFTLPEDISKNILSLMRSIKLRCGSIDMIRGHDGLFYFLEVNPIGQLSMVSKSCNYPLEKLLAQQLIRMQYDAIS